MVHPSFCACYAVYDTASTFNPLLLSRAPYITELDLLRQVDRDGRARADTRVVLYGVVMCSGVIAYEA